jgi:phosphoglycolate phosphatase-like HAD superfamily hydrolase
MAGRSLQLAYSAAPPRSHRRDTAAKKYILWDNDGVLVDTEYGYFRATQCVLAELGVAPDESTCLQRMIRGELSWELAQAAGIDAALIVAKRQERDASCQAYRWPSSPPPNAPISS